jgi:hypothetical protein
MTKISAVVSRLRKTAVEIKSPDGSRSWISLPDQQIFTVGMELYVYLCQNEEELTEAETDANASNKPGQYSLFCLVGSERNAKGEDWDRLSDWIDHEAARGKPLKTGEIIPLLPPFGEEKK